MEHSSLGSSSMQGSGLEGSEVSSGAFEGFISSRFTELPSMGLPVISVQDWVVQLLEDDPKQRFAVRSVQQAMYDVSSGVEDRLEEGTQVLHLFGTLMSPVDQFLWAIFMYTIELFEMGSVTPERGRDRSTHGSCQYQIYREFNKACEMYGHIEHLLEEQEQEWALFHTFAQWLDAAVRALPASPAVLYRSFSCHDLYKDYCPGLVGAWGGCLSASTTRYHSLLSLRRQNELPIYEKGCFIILSDEAKAIWELSEFFEEYEHLHRLDMQLEVCCLLPSCLLQALAFRGATVFLKRAGSQLSLGLWRQALDSTRFIYDNFLLSYIPGQVIEAMHSHVKFWFAGKVDEFVNAPHQQRVLLVTGRPGSGKTTASLWLTQRVYYAGWLWLFISLPCVKDPFLEGALLRHLLESYGLAGNDNAIHELKSQPIVLILDEMDEVTPTSSKLSWMDLNGFHDWHVKLVVTCAQEQVHRYGNFLGDHVKTLYLADLEPYEIERHIACRLLMNNAASPYQYDTIPNTEDNGDVKLACATLTMAALAALAVVVHEQQLAGIMSAIAKSRISKAYNNPLKLTMLTDLILTGHTVDFRSEAALYGTWLDCKLLTDDQQPDLHVKHKAQELAWSLHIKRLTHDTVGVLKDCSWFHCLPLHINNYNADALYSFQHKSLQEFLVASYLFRRLREGQDCMQELSSFNFTHDFPVLRFFGDLCRGDAAAGDIVRHLFGHVTDSQDNPAGGLCAANSISLLNATGVSFQGRDLHGIHIPGANLQCANLFQTDLHGAYLKGVDLKGAILDFTDLRGADLTDADVGYSMEMVESSGSVLSVAISWTSTFIVSGVDNGTLQMWDFVTGELVETLAGHSAEITSVAISRDSTFIVSGSRDKSVRVWDTRTGEVLHTLSGHTEAVNAVAISSEGAFVFSASSDQTVRVWHWNICQVVRILDGHTGSVNAIALSAEAPFLASGSDDMTVRLWDKRTGMCFEVLEGHTGPVNDVAFSPFNSYIISASDDQTVRVWKQATGELLHILTGHLAAVKSVAVSSDGSFVVSASMDHVLYAWSPLTGELLDTLMGHTAAVHSVAISRKSGCIISGSSDKMVRFWPQRTRRMAYPLEGHSRPVEALTFSPDGAFVISGSEDSIVRAWHSSTGELLNKFEGHTDAVTDVAVSSNGMHLFSSSADHTVRHWNFHTGELCRTFEGHSSAVRCVAISPDNQQVVSGSSDGIILVWRLKSGAVQYTFKGHTASVETVAIDSRSISTISGSADYTIRIWGLQTGKPMRSLTRHTSKVNTVAISGEGTVLVSGSEDGLILIWSLVSGKVMRELQGQMGSIHSVTISRDDAFIVSGSSDGSVVIWDPWTGKQLRHLRGHTAAVKSVGVTLDGKYIVSGSRDTTVRIWQWAPVAPGENSDMDSDNDSDVGDELVADSVLVRCIRAVDDHTYQAHTMGLILSPTTKLSKNLLMHLTQFGAVVEADKVDRKEKRTKRWCNCPFFF